MQEKLNFDNLQRVFRQKHYRWFEDGDYNLNLIGIRSRERREDKFDDIFCIAFSCSGREYLFCFDCSTDPGVFYRQNPVNENGAAIVVPGQYPGLWQLGLHRRHPALVQSGPVSVYRDNNRDAQLDTNTPVQTGFFAINCHRATGHGRSNLVGKWSAGCQVFADAHDFAILLGFCRKARALWGNSFTYTLLDEADL